jgi:anti-anti-sigma regulatory factor
MELSVEVKQHRRSSLYVCRGNLRGGSASEYLFDLLTRSHDHDVIVDVSEIAEFGEAGLRAIALSCHVLSYSQRRLFLRSAPSAILEQLRSRHSASVLEWPDAGAPRLSNGASV